MKIFSYYLRSSSSDPPFDERLQKPLYKRMYVAIHNAPDIKWSFQPTDNLIFTRSLEPLKMNEKYSRFLSVNMHSIFIPQKLLERKIKTKTKYPKCIAMQQNTIYKALHNYWIEICWSRGRFSISSSIKCFMISASSISLLIMNHYHLLFWNWKIACICMQKFMMLCMMKVKILLIVNAVLFQVDRFFLTFLYIIINTTSSF